LLFRFPLAFEGFELAFLVDGPVFFTFGPGFEFDFDFGFGFGVTRSGSFLLPVS
jgi:hypothetical protein